jgi:hypothetical protein
VPPEVLAALLQVQAGTMPSAASAAEAQGDPYSPWLCGVRLAD